MKILNVGWPLLHRWSAARVSQAPLGDSSPLGNRQRKSLIILSALIFALVATVLSESASAADITYVSISGNWHDPVDNLPGSQPGEPVITNGVPTSSINWGVTSGSQSGYDFTGTIPPPQTLPGPSPLFPLGTFTHRNFEVSSPSLTSVQLDVVLVLSVDGVQTASIELHVYVQPRGNPEQRDALSLSDTAGRRVY